MSQSDVEWQGNTIFAALRQAAPDPRRARHPNRLVSIIHSRITRFRVEFLVVADEYGIVKPHVQFHLTLDPCHGMQEVTECRLSMKFLGEEVDNDVGELTLKASNFTGSHQRASGSFGFPLTQRGGSTKVRDWIQILRAHHSQQQLLNHHGIRGDLTGFDFTEQFVAGAIMPQQVDGCRDWIAQAFTRFHQVGLVALFGQELDDTPALYQNNEVRYLNFNQAIPNRSNYLQPAPFWFPDIIDKKFVARPTAEIPNAVRIQSLPMHRGRFHDATVVRQEIVIVSNMDGSDTYPFYYNYYNEASAGGPPGGPPPPQPPPGPPGGPGPSSYGYSGGYGDLGSTGGPSYGNPIGPPPSSAGAGASRSNQARSAAPRASNKPEPAPFVQVMFGDKIMGMCERNGPKDAKGRVQVYKNDKPHGFWSPKKGYERK